MAARGFLGAGDLYIARYESGVWGDYAGPFEADKFEIKPNAEIKEQVSKGKSSYGQVIESVSLAQPADFTATLTEVNKETLAIALLGTSAALTQASGTVSNEAVTASLDKWVQLSKTAVSSVVVTNSAGTTTYVAGTDYVVNTRLGMIKALSTGAITAAQALLVDFSHASVAGTRISGGTSSEVRARFKFDGVNLADQLPCIVTVHEAVISAASALDFLSNDFAKVEMPGRLKTPVGFTEPFTVDLLTA